MDVYEEIVPVEDCKIVCLDLRYSMFNIPANEKTSKKKTGLIQNLQRATEKLFRKIERNVYHLSDKKTKMEKKVEKLKEQNIYLLYKFLVCSKIYTSLKYLLVYKSDFDDEVLKKVLARNPNLEGIKIYFHDRDHMPDHYHSRDSE